MSSGSTVDHGVSHGACSVGDEGSDSKGLNILALFLETWRSTPGRRFVWSRRGLSWLLLSAGVLVVLPGVRALSGGGLVLLLDTEPTGFSF